MKRRIKLLPGWREQQLSDNCKTRGWSIEMAWCGAANFCGVALASLFIFFAPCSQADNSQVGYISAATATDDGPQDGMFDEFTLSNFGSVNNNGYTSFATAMDFPLPAIPVASAVSKASLTMRVNYVEGTRSLVLDGYAADGKIALKDFSAGQPVARVVLPPSTTFPVVFDVTDFVRNLLADGRPFAGFVLREEPPNTPNYTVLFFTMIGQKIMATPKENMKPKNEFPTYPHSRCLCLGLALAFSLTAAIAGSATWTLTGNMSAARRDHTATLLLNGKVLIVGWFSTTADLFDPATLKFSPIKKTLFIHGQGASAVRLLDGRVLIVGGAFPGNQAEIYDPASGTFSRTGDSIKGRTFATATLLPSGRVLLAGGGDPNPAGGSAELYDPASGSFSLTGHLQAGRVGATASLLPDGRVLVAGGSSDDITQACLNSAEIYDEESGSFALTGTMLMPRCSLWWSQAPVLPNGRVLIVGDLFTRAAELFDPATGMFSPTSDLTSVHSSGTLTLLANGQVLLAGGSESIGPVTTAITELYDSASGNFSAAPSMNAARQEHTATLLLDGRVLVTGGYNSLGKELSSAEIFSLGNQPPVANAGPDQEIEATSTSGAPVTLNGSASSDPDGDQLSFSWTGSFGVRTGAVSTLTLPLGSHVVNLRVDDGNGGIGNDRTQILVRDTTPPIVQINLQPKVLRPADHRLVRVCVSVEAADVCDPHPAVVLKSITSSEADEGLSDGDIARDIQGAAFGQDDREFFLRAERSVRGADRTYTIAYLVTDASGNQTTASAEVTVPQPVSREPGSRVTAGSPGLQHVP